MRYVVKKRWEVREQAPKEFIGQFPEFMSTTLQLLWNRELRSQELIDEFFNPDYGDDLHDPFLYKDMDKAVRITLEAMSRHEKIHIFGDYDHDGISGAALLRIFFDALDVRNGIYIPDRNTEGYGLSIPAIDEIIASESNILITIDCGTTNVEEIRYAKEKGLSVIVLDHHLVKDVLPPADAVVNAKRSDDEYPFDWLSGAGVAFKFLQALLFELRENDPSFSLREGWEKWLLDLVAIAAVGDIVPLLGENRTLVTYGLVVLAQTRNTGIRYLMETAGIKPWLKEAEPDCKIPVTNIDTHTVGFMIVPRINAASRMDHADTAYELLITKDEEEARLLARRLEDTNRERQKRVDEVTKEVKERISMLGELPPVIFEGSENWHAGILGIVASRLVETYHRPVFLHAQNGDESKGSCRAFGAFNVVEAMASCKEFFKNFGGHAHAGGFSASVGNLDEAKQKLYAYTEAHFKKEDFIPILDIESELAFQDISWDFYTTLKKFEPFGESNPVPLFLLRNLRVGDIRFVGQNKNHVQLRLESGAGKNFNSFRAIYFNGESVLQKVVSGDEVDIVCELRLEEWNGSRELRLRIVDARMSRDNV